MFSNFSESSVTGDICNCCYSDISNSVALIIDSKPFCFSCSKDFELSLAKEAQAKQREVVEKYRPILAKAEAEHKALELRASNYRYSEMHYVATNVDDRRLRYFDSHEHKDGCLLPFLGLTGLIFPFLIWYFISNSTRKKEYEQARSAALKKFKEINGVCPNVPSFKRPKNLYYEKNTLTLSISKSCNHDTMIGTGYDRMEVLKRDGFVCQTCELQFNASELEVHHVIPRAKGGSDYKRNLITLCIPCHMEEVWFDHQHIKARYNNFR